MKLVRRGWTEPGTLNAKKQAGNGSHQSLRLCTLPHLLERLSVSSSRRVDKWLTSAPGQRLGWQESTGVWGWGELCLLPVLQEHQLPANTAVEVSSQAPRKGPSRPLLGVLGLESNPHTQRELECPQRTSSVTSLCYYNKLPHTSWFKTTEIYSFIVLQAISPKLVTWGQNSLQRERIHSSRFWQLQAFLGLWPQYSSLCLQGHILFSVCVSKLSLPFLILVFILLFNWFTMVFNWSTKLLYNIVSVYII